VSLFSVTYGDSACDLGAAMAKAGRRCVFHETTGLVRIATICVVAPWRLCVEFPSDIRRMERKVAEKQSRNETGGCCHVSRFNEPSAARRKLCFLLVSRVLQWRNQVLIACCVVLLLCILSSRRIIPTSRSQRSAPAASGCAPAASGPTPAFSRKRLTDTTCPRSVIRSGWGR